MILSEQSQIDELRNRCDNAKYRIWVASPYIGNLKDVQRIIGGKWILPSVDCRVLTDVKAGFIRQDTFNELLYNNIEVRSLLGLHAKIYIVDDWCLVTSVNLTGTAFLCRFEMGVEVTGAELADVIKQYEAWWNAATVVNSLSKLPSKALTDYQDGTFFKKRFKAKPYKSAAQDKYKLKCDMYRQFAQIYDSVTGRSPKMKKDGYTLLQEVDFFFNYIYHDHPQKPSHGQSAVRAILPAKRDMEIKSLFAQMVQYYNNDPQLWRLDCTNVIRYVLDNRRIHYLTWVRVEQVVMSLHCLASYPINRTKFLNKQNNNLGDIKDCWNQLLHTGNITYDKIEYVTSRLANFGISSIQELIGWYYPDTYPLMNGNSDCGMRYFGFDVK